LSISVATHYCVQSVYYVAKPSLILKNIEKQATSLLDII
jgi:hypothetical protein